MPRRCRTSCATLCRNSTSATCRWRLPSAWLARADAPAGERDLHRSEAGSHRPAGCCRQSVLASFDWRLAVGDNRAHTTRSCARSRRRRARSCRVDGRWQSGARSRRRSARLRFLERRQPRRGFRPARACGLGTRDRRGGARAGGRCSSTDIARRTALGARDARFRPREDAGGRCGTTCSRSRRRGHGWLRLLGDLGIGGDPGRRHGAREDGARRSRCSCRSGRRPAHEAFGPDARRVPDERGAAVGGRGSTVLRRGCVCICIMAATGLRTRSCIARANAGRR